MTRNRMHGTFAAIVFRDVDNAAVLNTDIEGGIRFENVENLDLRWNHFIGERTVDGGDLESLRAWDNRHFQSPAEKLFNSWLAPAPGDAHAGLLAGKIVFPEFGTLHFKGRTVGNV